MQPPSRIEPPLRPSDDAPDDPAEVAARETVAHRSPPSLEGLAVAGFTRRRAAWLVGALVVAWILVVFARQMSDAAAKSAEADRARLANAALAADVSSLQRELELVRRQAYIEQRARGLGLGQARERAFVLTPGAPPLAPDAPGSAAVRLGAVPATPSPLESWLSLLFGPEPAN
jgi:cell division protein FtsB